jgi:hypothetical protein
MVGTETVQEPERQRRREEQEHDRYCSRFSDHLTSTFRGT